MYLEDLVAEVSHAGPMHVDTGDDRSTERGTYNAGSAKAPSALFRIGQRQKL